MIRDITIGQYYAVDSPVHRLDPRVKLAGTLIYIISLFISANPLSYIVSGCFLIFVIHVSRVPARYMMKGLKPIIIILLLSVSINLFMSSGTPVSTLPVLKNITWEGIQRACYMAVRLIMLILGSTIMTLTTTPNALTDGLERGLGFLRVIHIPVHEMAMMMSIALRFIPILLDETDKIMKAQMARGADFESGSLIRKAKAMVPLLVPLFISAFRRAADLALALEARCYHGGDHRTHMKELKYGRKDVWAYIILLAYLGAVVLLGIVWRAVGL